MNLKEKVKSLTTSPGVYLMKDSLGGIIYVGKAKNLKRRVQSYFQSSRPHSPKVQKLVKNLKDFDYIVTDTEFEAFMLECKLIKELKPVYNKKMKSPLSYTYVIIRMDTASPGIEIANSPIENDNIFYFGPYTNRNTVERAVQGIKECTKILCSSPSTKKSPCLNYSLGLCIGMCMGGAAEEQYRAMFYKIIALLNGKDTGILDEMKQKMQQASMNFDFEAATKYRDYIDAVSTLINKERVIGFTEENKNMAVIEPLNCESVKLFLVKGSKLLFTEKYSLKKTCIEQLKTVIKKDILEHFNIAYHNSYKEVTRDEIDEAQIIYSYLKGSACSYITVPEQWLGDETTEEFDETLNKLLDCRGVAAL